MRRTRRFHWAGSYDSSYPRHRVIHQGLLELGFNVTETRDQSFLPWRWIRMCVALLKVPRATPLVIGESSNYLAPLIALARLQRRRVTFDSFVLLAEIHREDRRGVVGFWWGLLGSCIDQLNCRLANTVLVDSDEQRKYLVEHFRIPREKIHVVNVGVETDLFVPQESSCSPGNGPLNILFYGSFLPLHGVETILGAARLLSDATPYVTFTLVGQGDQYERMRATSRQLGLNNVRFGPRSVPYEALRDLIADADVCLGIFGDTPQARRVIPNKVFQAAACGRPVITADTPGIRELFTPETAVLVPAADPEALAAAIQALSVDPSRRHMIGRKGAELIRDRFGPARIAQQFLISQAGP